MKNYAFEMTNWDGLRQRKPEIHVTDELLEKASRIGGGRLVSLIKMLESSLSDNGLKFPMSLELALKHRGIGKVSRPQLERLGLIKE